jgi:hypothetical protein
VCGNGKTIGNPGGTIALPGQPLASCLIIQKVGAEGYIPNSVCPLIPNLITSVCGCKPGKTPTVAPLRVSKKPIKAPTMKPGAKRKVRRLIKGEVLDSKTELSDVK